MLFNSWQYAVFLPVVFALYWALPHKLRWPLLLAASYYFYMSWNVKYVVLILFTTAVSYTAALLLEKTEQRKKRRLLLTTALVACLGVLFVFKYWNFFFGSLETLARRFAIPLHATTLRLLLPVGISFYTFQTLGYVIDVYRGDVEAERNFGVYATFISFFPQLVAGPIERTKNLLPQIKAEHTFDYADGVLGLRQMLWGFFKKIVIADTLAIYSDRVFNSVYHYEGGVFLLAGLFFTFQIYCDFSGYSDIAVGTARLFGIKLMTNFDSPYFSKSIKEFWSRWHISLSTWFKDYVYIPLGGNRKGKFQRNVNILITFILSGLWHGANFTFALWGTIHGVGRVTENIFEKVKGESSETDGLFSRMLKTIFVFAFCTLAWIVFRANSIGDVGYIFSSMLKGISSPASYIFEARKAFGVGRRNYLFILLVLSLLGCGDYAGKRTSIARYMDSIPKVFRIALYYVLVIMCICAFGKNSGSNPFVYFQF